MKANPITVDAPAQALTLVLSLSLLTFARTASAETAVDIEVRDANGLLSTKFDVPDNNPRMLVGHFNDPGWGIMRAAMVFEIEGIPDGASIVSASLSIFARSAPWSPANPDGSPPTMVVKDAGPILDDFEDLPLAWGAYETEGGNVSGPALASITPEDYKNGISEENVFASSDAFVAAVQKAIDAGSNTVNLVIHCPELDESDPPPPGKNFFRIDNHENDTDTIPMLHLAYATDSDGDGMEDDWELRFFPDDTELMQLAKGQDFDSDGLVDEAEFFWKSDPTKTDSDGDTVPDGEEVNTYGSDPSEVDSDGDDINDDQEIAANPFVTDPAKADTDGDGLEDNNEIAVRQTDPTKSDTDGDTYDDGLEVRLMADPNDAGSTPGLLARGGLWNVLHAEIAGVEFVEELDEIIANEDYIDSVEVQLPEINFDNLVAGDYSESEINYPLFEEPTTGLTTLLRVTGSILVKEAAEVTLGFNTNASAIMRVDGEEVEVFEIGRANSGRASMVATLNLAGGPHEIEVLHWFTGTAGFNMIVAYEPGAVDEFVKEDFELMPALSVEPKPFVITSVDRADAGVTLEWQSAIGESYVLERSPTLNNWLELEDGIPSAGDTTSFTDANPPVGTAYYRLRR